MRWRDRLRLDRTTRRQWLTGVAAGLASGLMATRSRAADTAAADSWPVRIFQATPRSGELRLPVVTAVAAHPGEPRFASAGDDHQVYLWNLDTGHVDAELTGHRDWVRGLAFAPGGQWLASAGNDRRILLWDVASRTIIHEFDDLKHAVNQLAWSHEGRWLASIGFADCLRIYDTETRQLGRVLRCPDQDMRTVAVSPDDRLVAAAGRSGVVRLWQMPQGDHVFDYRPHRRRIHVAQFSPDGQYLVTAGDDRWLHIHPIGGDETGFDLPLAHGKTLCGTFYGPHHFATGGSDNRIRLWDLATGNGLGELHGHAGSVAALARHGAALISGSFDTTIRVWSIGPNLAQIASPPNGGDARR